MSEKTKDTVEENEIEDQKANSHQESEQAEDPAAKQEGSEEAKKEEPRKKPQTETEKLREEIEKLVEKNEDLRDKYVRLFADFDNYKKRMAKEKLGMLNEAGKNVIVDLLPVLDDFSRALKTIKEGDDLDAVKNGSELIFHKLKKTLEQKGLKEMESIGRDFDPEYHEAVTEIPAPSEEQKGKVVDEVEKGYYLNEKIIRYAKVVVGK